MLWRAFRFPLLLSAAALAATLWLGGLDALFTVSILAVLEISLSFENAVVNAKILGRLNRFWQQLFLTLGIVIAVFGMRLVFPLAIVGLAANLGAGQVIDLALHQPDQYAAVLTAAHPAIAAFGGVFLLMLFLDFIMERRDIRWLRRFENLMIRVGEFENIGVMASLLVLAFVANWSGPEHAGAVLLAGIFGLFVYLAANALIRFFDVGRSLADGHATHHAARAVAQAGLFSFIYLELIDASFSFDGVVGSFAITNQILLIAAGLGIGALFVRSMTVYLVKRGTLARYVYLEHGAHYAVGTLAILLFVTIKYDIPQVVTGLFGLGFITVAFLDSVEYRKRHPELAHHRRES